jgi:hypothetical protein
LPPIWLNTLAYSFSAPMATMREDLVPAEAARVANVVKARPVASATTSSIRAEIWGLHQVIEKSVD